MSNILGNDLKYEGCLGKVYLDGESSEEGELRYYMVRDVIFESRGSIDMVALIGQYDNDGSVKLPIHQHFHDERVSPEILEQLLKEGKFKRERFFFIIL